MPDLVASDVLVIELTLLLIGSALLWRFGFSRQAREAPRLLTPWEVTLSDFFLFVWLVICGGLLLPFLANLAMKSRPMDESSRLIFGTAVFQLGMLSGVGFYRLVVRRRSAPAVVPSPAHPAPPPVISGPITYLISMPVVVAVGFLWQGMLKLCHIPAPPQEAMDILRNTRDPVPLTVLLVSALIIAPINEELIFRAGLFRYLRTRLPRWAALLLPAGIFGLMHANVASFLPLMALGVVFSLAYERTGRISTTIVAHALFNLSTTVLVFAIEP